MEMRQQLHQLLLTTSTGQHIRQQIFTERDHLPPVEQFDPILTKGTWAGTIELVGLVHLYNLHVTTHELSHHRGTWTIRRSEYFPEYLPANNATPHHIHLIASNSHYEALADSIQPPQLPLHQYTPISVNSYSPAAAQVTSSEETEECLSPMCKKLSQTHIGCCQVTNYYQGHLLSALCETTPAHVRTTNTNTEISSACQNRALNFLCPNTCHATCLQQQHRNYLTSAVSARKISASYSGLFADEIIKSAEYIGEYLGEVQTRSEYLNSMNPSHPAFQPNRDISYTATIWDPQRMDDPLYVDALNTGAITRFANHRCKDSNSELVVIIRNSKPTLFLRASKTILPGTEITFNYNWEWQSSTTAHKCFCDPSLGPHFIENRAPTTINDYFQTNQKRPSSTQPERGNHKQRYKPNLFATPHPRHLPMSTEAAEDVNEEEEREEEEEGTTRAPERDIDQARQVATTEATRTGARLYKPPRRRKISQATRPQAQKTPSAAQDPPLEKAVRGKPLARRAAEISGSTDDQDYEQEHQRRRLPDQSEPPSTLQVIPHEEPADHTCAGQGAVNPCPSEDVEHPRFSHLNRKPP
jgi:hypothetical protein